MPLVLLVVGDGLIPLHTQDGVDEWHTNTQSGEHQDSHADMVEVSCDRHRQETEGMGFKLA